MQQNIYYIRFALQFADRQIPELVTEFNAQVNSRAWSSMRAYHDLALIDEFLRRGIDVSSICMAIASPLPTPSPTIFITTSSFPSANPYI